MSSSATWVSLRRERLAPRVQRLRPGAEGLREALCTLGNGYFATRGAAPEARRRRRLTTPGPTWPGSTTGWPPSVAGRAVENESIVNLPNWLPLTFRAEDGCWLDAAAEILEHRQELDLRRGVLIRLARFRDDAGRITRVTQRRFVSHGRPAPGRARDDHRRRELVGPVAGARAARRRVSNSGVARYRALAGDSPRPRSRPRASTTRRWRLQAQTRALAHPRGAGGADPPLPDGARRRGRADAAARSQASSGTSSMPTSAKASRDRREGRRRSTPHATPAISEPGDAARERVGATRRRLRRAARAARLAWHQLWRRFGISHRGGRGAGRADPATSTSSTCCRRSRRTPPTSTSACRPAGCTARPTAGTSSGTRCSSSRSSTCGFRELARALAPLPLPAASTRPAGPRREAGLRRGDVPVAERERRAGGDADDATSTRARAAGCPTTPHLQRHINAADRLQRLAVLPGHRRRRVPAGSTARR